MRHNVDAIRARTETEPLPLMVPHIESDKETEPLPLMVPHIESDKGTIRKVRQYAQHYTVITDGMQGVKGWQPKLLYYSRTDALDKAFADKNLKPFAVLASTTIGGMK